MSDRPRTFLMTFRANVICTDEVEAMMIADVIKEEGSKHLDEEDGDDLDVTQVLDFSPALEPTELIDRLVRTRNDLIRTRIKECWDVAQQLDQVIWGLQKRVDPMMQGNYPYGRFMDYATAILERGEFPT